MLEEAGIRAFERSPIGRFTCTGSCVLWVASDALIGWRVWGRPDENETRIILQLLQSFGQYPLFKPQIAVVADTRGVEVINPPALALLVPWVIAQRRVLRQRIRLQANVIRRDSIGFLLVGIIASIGDVQPIETYTEPLEAFRSVAGEQGRELCEEVEAIVRRVSSIPHELQVLRTMLAANVETSIDDAAKALSTSARSLQRLLQNHATSFHDEQTDARFLLAKKLLDASDDKLSAVARRVGWSERTLTSIFRSKTGLTPTDWRKRAAAKETA